MKLYYFHSDEGNFGDDLNAWLWDELRPDFRAIAPDVTLSGVGSILSHHMPPCGKWVIMGSGTGYGLPSVDLHAANVHVAFVRGPLSARVLGFPADKWLTDSAILLAKLPEFQPLPQSQRSGKLFVPHITAAGRGNWQAAAQMAGLEFVDPRGDAKTVIHRIRSAELVVADAMHSAIIADTMRVPWIPVRTSHRINHFKWLDWTLGLDLPYKPVSLPPSSREEHIEASVPRKLIEPGAYATVEEFAVAFFRHQQEAAPQGSSLERNILRLRAAVARRIIGSKAEARMIDNAARALRELATAQGYLSGDEKFGAALSAATGHLGRLEDYARSL